MGISCSLPRCECRILPLQEGCLVLDGVFDALVVLDVLLRAVDDADDAELHGDDAPAENIDGVGA